MLVIKVSLVPYLSCNNQLHAITIGDVLGILQKQPDTDKTFCGYPVDEWLWTYYNITSSYHYAVRLPVRHLYFLFLTKTHTVETLNRFCRFFCAIVRTSNCSIPIGVLFSIAECLVPVSLFFTTCYFPKQSFYPQPTPHTHPRPASHTHLTWRTLIKGNS